MWLRPGSPLKERTDPAQSQGHSSRTHSDSETTPGGWRLSQETPQRRLLGAGQLRGPGGSRGAPGRSQERGDGRGGTGWQVGGGRTRLPRRGASPQGQPGARRLAVLSSPSRAPCWPPPALELSPGGLSTRWAPLYPVVFKPDHKSESLETYHTPALRGAESLGLAWA